MIETWLMFMGTFLLGLYIGSRSDFKSDTTNMLADIGKKSLNLEKTINRKLYPVKFGPVERPTQQQIIVKENPKLAEEIEEQKKAFGAFGVDKVKPTIK